MGEGGKDRLFAPLCGQGTPRRVHTGQASRVFLAPRGMDRTLLVRRTMQGRPIARAALFAVTLSCDLAGCAQGGIPVEASSSTTVTSIAVYTSASPPRSYSVAGFVSATGSDSDRVVMDLRRDAAALGATAILGLRLTTSPGGWLTAYGVAVRWS